MTCPKCGASNPGLATRCAQCDSALPGSHADSTWGGGGQSAPSPVPVSTHADAVTGGGGFAIGGGNWPTGVGTSPARARSEPEVDFGSRYRVEKLLGQGGMGAVYRAYDLDLHRTVALKLVRPELMVHPEAMQRFKQELLLASKISHRNILRIHDLGDASGTKFISMAFVEGSDLHKILQTEGKLSVERTLHISKQLCAALEAAHTENVVHRDMKPQNIMLDKDDHVYVSDFGLAKSIEAEGGGMTMTGELLGTPRYMAPEQIECKAVDGRTDLYALGLIMYEMLTGDIPFQAESTYQLMYKRANEPAPAPNLSNPEIPGWLNRVVMKCLERDPARRYQSATEMLEDIKAERAPDIIAPPIKKKGHSKQIVMAALAVVIVAIALITGMLIRGRTGGQQSTATSNPVTVLVGDFSNQTGDPVFDGTLEPMFNVALENASFINAYNRGRARKLAQQLPNPTDKLDDATARLIAVGQGVNAIVTGQLSRRGSDYALSVSAIDAVTGKTLASAEASAANKDDVVAQLPKLAAPIRKALGDSTPESAQLLAAQGSFEAGNIESVHEYSVAMEQQFTGKMQDALQSFSKASELDPNFARAYSGMAAAYGNMGQPANAQKYAKLAMQHIDRLSERERYRTRGTYYLNTANWQKCVEEYSELVKRFPGDNIAHTNLANCYSQLRDWPNAVGQAKEDVSIHQNAAGLGNLALFSIYAGEFQSGEQTALKLRQLNPSFEYGYLAQAFAQMGEGNLSQASDTYRKLATVSQLGASMSASGLADIALYQGRFSDAIRILEEGVSADAKAKRKDSAADRYTALAYVHLLRGEKQACLEALAKALATNQSVKTRFLVARTFAELGDTAKAQSLAAKLASEIQPEPQAYAKIINGNVALKRGDHQEAIKDFTDANSTLDTWIGRFDLGRAYLQAGAFTEADSEFDRCIKRRGETIALFLDEVPTYGYFPMTYYYQGRVRQGLKSPGFVESYRSYLNIRGSSSEDPLVPELRQLVR